MSERESAIMELAGAGHVIRCASCGRTFRLAGVVREQALACPYCKVDLVHSEADEG